MGDSQHTQYIQINKVMGENEKCVFYFMEKKHTDFLASPILSLHFTHEKTGPQRGHDWPKVTELGSDRTRPWSLDVSSSQAHT